MVIGKTNKNESEVTPPLAGSSLTTTEPTVNSVLQKPLQGESLNEKTGQSDNSPKPALKIVTPKVTQNNDVITVLANNETNEQKLATTSINSRPDQKSADIVNALQPGSALSGSVKPQNEKAILLPNRYRYKENCFPKLRHRPGWYIDGYYEPRLNARSLKAKNAESQNYAQLRTDTESFVYSHAFGMRVSYIFPMGLALRSGLNYAAIREKFQIYERDRIIRINDKTGQVIDTSYEDRLVRHKNAYRFIDIPLTVGYEES